MKNILRSFLLSAICFISYQASSQNISGVWEGAARSKVIGRNTKMTVEVKLILKGDSLYGTTYHYEGPGMHHRYSLKGRFNKQTREIIFQEETLLLEISNKFFFVEPKLDRRIYRGKVFISGDAMSIECDLILRTDTTKVMALSMERNNKLSQFNDEWDYVIEKGDDKVDDKTIDSINNIARPFDQKEYVEAMKKMIKEQKEEKKALAAREAKEKEEAKLAMKEDNQKAKELEKAKADSIRAEKLKADLAKKEEARRLKDELAAREDSIKAAKALAKDIAAKEELARKELNKAKQDSIRKSIAAAKEQAAKEEIARKEQRAKEELAKREAEKKIREEELRKLNSDSAKLAAANAAINRKFEERKKTLVTEVPLIGDSIEIRLFDNGVVDGDSIAVFLNNQLIEKNIGLTTRSHDIKLAVKDIPDNSEFTMVAENMGSIPPNTAMMIVLVGEERYQVRLESTESSSAMIKLLRKKK